jgi:HEAT repeats
VKKPSILILALGVILVAPAATGRPLDRIGQLVRLLETSRSYKIRAQVVTHLARLKHERVTLALRRALSDEHATVRKVAATALTSRGVKPEPLPPSPRAARAVKDREQARERKLKAHNAKARLYVTMGTLGNSSSTGGAALGRVFGAALRKEFAAVPSVMTRWEGGIAPTAAQLKKRQMTGFVLDGAIKTLERRRRGRHYRYYCMVKISLATYPGNSMKAFYTGEASTKLLRAELTPARQYKIRREIVRLAAHKARVHFVQDYFAYRQPSAD